LAQVFSACFCGAPLRPPLLQAVAMRVACWLVALAAAIKETHLRQREQAVEAVGAFKHRLRVCNAFPYEAGLDVYRGKTEKLNGDAPLPYKGCGDFKVHLKPGDKLDFRVGTASAGKFSVTDLPNSDSLLLLTILRHDQETTESEFESHVFANLLNAQVAIIDTYKGPEGSRVYIQDVKDAKRARKEQLRYGSVVALNKGKYEVVLEEKEDHQVSKRKLVAVERESYVILRVGVNAKSGPSYSEDLVVYPQHSEELLTPTKSGASVVGSCVAVLLTAMPFMLW